jgi:hypothetical protein
MVEMVLTKQVIMAVEVAALGVLEETQVIALEVQEVLEHHRQLLGRP